MKLRLTAGPHAVVLHTARNMDVPVRIDWCDERPAPALDAYRHVVEASFACPSGRLVLAGMTDYEPDATRLEVRPGGLGVRVNLSGLDTLSNNGLDGDDRYLFQLWPGHDDLRLLKSWSEPSN